MTAILHVACEVFHSSVKFRPDSGNKKVLLAINCFFFSGGTFKSQYVHSVVIGLFRFPRVNWPPL